MAILNVVTSVTGLVGVTPRIVYIDTNDTLATVTTAGYLNAAQANGASFKESDMALVTIKASPSATSVQVAWLEVSYSAGDWSLVAAESTSPLASAHIFVGNAAGVATDVAMTGDIGISNTGVTAIQSGVIVNADINASAAIAYSKLAALPSTNILVGNGSNVPTAVAMSGDATLANTGALTIANTAVSKAKLAAVIQPAAVIKYAAQYTTTGGAAAEAITVTGALSTDLAFVQLVDDGTNNVTVLNAVMTADTLTVTFSADPGNDAIINYQIVRLTP